MAWGLRQYRLMDFHEGFEWMRRTVLGIYSLFVSCLSSHCSLISWLVWAAPASCTHSHDRTHNTVRYVLHIHEPLDPQHPPAYTPSLKAVQSSRLQGMEWVRISLSCERALTTHLKANGKPARFLCDFNHLPGFLASWILDLDLDLELDSLPTPPFLFSVLFLFIL